MSTCHLCSSKVVLSCKECNQVFCSKCLKLKHNSSLDGLNHTFYSRCEECEDEESKNFCPSCEQNLCLTCDNKIHNKGKRALHTREQIPINNEFLPLTELIVISEDFLTQNFPAVNKEVDHIKFKAFITDLCKPQQIKLESVAFIFFFSSEPQITYSNLVNKLTEDYRVAVKLAKNQLDTYRKKKVQYTDEQLLGQIKSDDNIYRATAISSLADLLTNLQRIILLDTQNCYELAVVLHNIQKFRKLALFRMSEKSGKSELKEITGESLQLHISQYYTPESKHIKTHSSPPGIFYTDLMPSSRDDYAMRNFISPTMQANIDFGVPKGMAGHQGSLHGAKTKPKSFNLTNNTSSNTNINNNINSANLQDFSTPSTNSFYVEHPFYSKNQSFDGQYLNIDSNPEYLLHSSFDQGSRRAQQQTMKYGAGSQIYPTPRGSLSQSYLYQANKEVEIDGSLKLSHYIQNELRALAQEGDLIIPRETLVAHIAPVIETKFNRKIADVLKKAEEANIIHTTIRKFADFSSLYFVGLHLDNLTIESLGWIIKSIKKDGMTPTEKLILSRIKESFALKIDQKYWKILLNYLLAFETEGRQKVQAADKPPIPALSVSKTNDPVLNTETYIIYLKNDEWIPDDQGVVDESSELWKIFLKFIDDFFRDDDNGSEINTVAKQDEIDYNSLSNKKLASVNWSSSVENALNRSASKKDKPAKSSNKEVKAIPGGRYGCAQFLKICGPEPLKKMSLGKLNLFVQEAINKGILRYQRTLLIKNKTSISVSGEKSDSEGVKMDGVCEIEAEKRNYQLKKIKDALYEILMENTNGVSLAQIPQHLRKKLDFPFNLQKLGFPKLKNLLSTMSDDIKIELSGTNHSYAILKAGFTKPQHQPAPQQHPTPSSTNKERESTAYTENSNYLDPDYNPFTNTNTSDIINMNTSFTNNGSLILDKEQNPMAKAKVLANRFKSYSKKFSITPSSDVKSNKMNRKNISTLDEYLSKVRNIIEAIIIENKFGITIDRLYQMLSTKLGFNFDVRLFNCKDFYEFLINYGESLVDIEIKRNFVSANKITLIIYPKNFRFGPANKYIDTSKLDPKKQLNPQAGLNLHSQPFHFGNDKSQFHDHKKSDMEQMQAMQLQMQMQQMQMQMQNNNNIVPEHLKQQSYQGISPQYNHNTYLQSTYQMQNRNKSTSSTTTPNIIQFSPIIFYGDNEDMFTQSPDKQGNTHNRSISYCNLNFGNPNEMNPNGGNGVTLISNINTVIHSRNESKNTVKIPEESNAEINENLRFIEELLKDNDDIKSMETNFTLERDNSSFDMKSPNFSIASIKNFDLNTNGSFLNPKNHIKRFSEDYNLPTKGSGNVKVHNRFSSTNINEMDRSDKNLTTNLN